MTQEEENILISRVESHTHLEFVGSPVDGLLKFAPEATGEWFDGDEFDDIADFIDKLEKDNPDIRAEIEILDSSTYLYLSMERT